MRLNSSIKEVKGIGDKTAGLFLKINIETIRDLISYFPRTYVQFPEIKRPDEVVEGETAAVIGQIRQTPIVKRVRSMQITVTSIVGMGKRLELVWFRLPYIKNSLHPGENYVFYGKVQHKNGRFVMEQPAIYTPEKYEAMEHLIRHGHTRIAFLGRRELRNRYAAYRIALETYGLPFYPELTLFDRNAVSVEVGALLIRQLLALPSPPSAVFCGTDKLAIGAMQTLRELKVKVPEEISIVGFDDISAASTCEIPLSTVHVPYFELGKAAVGLLFKRMKSGGDVPSKTLMTNYVMRQTTAEYHG